MNRMTVLFGLELFDSDSKKRVGEWIPRHQHVSLSCGAVLAAAIVENIMHMFFFVNRWGCDLQRKVSLDLLDNRHETLEHKTVARLTLFAQSSMTGANILG